MIISRWGWLTVIIVAGCLCIWPVEGHLQEIKSQSVPSINQQDPIQQIPSHPSNNSGYPSKTSEESFETDFSAFKLQGKRVREKLEIVDMDTIITKDGRRFIPLIRLLNTLEVKWTDDNGRITFQPEGCQAVTLDTYQKTIEINSTTKPVEVFAAVSDISMGQDFYLPPESISEIFSIELEWDDIDYAFSAKTDKSLSIWKRSEGTSLLGIKTQKLIEQLPQAHPSADPLRRKLSLDFMEIKGRIKYKAVDPNMENSAVADSLEQTFWGALANGRYKMRISEPDLNYYESKFDVSDDPSVMIDWGEWRYRTDKMETVAGDSIFGLNDLTYNSVSMTGLRVNGLLGIDKTKQEKDKSRLGYSNIFGGPQNFEGFAPVGSKVELYINDRLIDTYEVTTSIPSMPGTGRYTFEDISLAPGNLNDIRIVITDPDGVETVIEKSMLGDSSLLAQGGFAFLTGLGTNRDTDEWDTRGIFSGGRFFYGITNRLTIGATMAYQEDFFEPAILSSSESGDRQYPYSSMHTGAQFTWQLFERSVLVGDFSWVQWDEDPAIDEQETFEDLAFNFDWHIFPIDKQNIDFQSFYFWYGPDFFDGVHRNLMDRQGYVFNTNIKNFADWRFQAAGGQVWDNVEQNSDETLSVDFETIEISSKIIPLSTFTFSVDRFAPDWNEDAKTLFSYSMRCRPFSGLDVSALYSTGDDIRFDENDDFLDGLTLPGISRYASKAKSAMIRKSLPWGGSLALNYFESGSKERASVIHMDRFSKWVPLEMRTEVGYDIDIRDYFFENRTEMPLGDSGRSRFGWQARYEDQEWKVEVYLNITEGFSFFDGHCRHITSRRVNPESTIVCGKVFLDRNANALLDEEEMGIEDIEVSLNNQYDIATDENGNFLMSVPGNTKTGIINLHPDNIPAIYKCTHGRQEACFKDREITRINLGLAPVNNIIGYIVSKSPDNERKPVIGTRIFVSSKNSLAPVAESITANDGSYYLENIFPGKYVLHIDNTTVPFESNIKDEYQTIEILPSDDSQEIKLPDIVLIPAEVSDDEYLQ